ncbi:nucleotidyl transferase AbiEii/AbiGii toxin family protein [Microbacterium sp.]|uniref:nucleotidyl transferase AbiEii/AbiGii toxin family protein n=1 Tax=Microbacterium sp. TaxID=51671 RepID=UPI00257CB24E|nr:nucleotidyl transferase AbiEii/AbiGii toxin family protein [Microbacterium sp.]
MIASPPATVFRFEEATFELGVTAFEAGPAEPVRIYDAARTVVDLMRFRKRLGEPVAHAALHRYPAAPSSKPALLNFGDPVAPAPRTVELPSLRPDAPPIRILGYPIETVLAEKLVTAIELGRANTRVRDFADIHLLTGTQALQCGELRDALTATAAFRGTTLIPLMQATEGLAVLRDSTYVAYRKGLGEAGASLPARFSDAVAAAADFVDPVLDGLDGKAVWSPAERNWNTAPATPSVPTETATGRSGL